MSYRIHYIEFVTLGQKIRDQINEQMDRKYKHQKQITVINQ